MKADTLAKRAKQLELLSRIGLEIASAFDLAKLLSAVAVLTTETLGYDNCAIFLLEGEELVIKAAYLFPKKVKRKKIRLGEGVVGRCGQTKEIVNVGSASKCPYYIPSGLPGIQSEIAVPIVFAGHLLAVLTIESATRNAFSEEDELVLGVLGSQLGVAIRNVRLTQKKQKELHLLHRIGFKIISRIELDRLLLTIVKLIREKLGYSNCAIFLPSGEKVVLKAQSHFPKKVLGLEIPFGKGIVGRCAARRKAVIVGDVSNCDYYIPSGLPGIRAALALPILFENRLVGVLATESRRKNAYGSEDVRLLQILSSQIGVALRNAEMLEEIKRMAITDSLTGLYNYRYFITKLEQETARARRYSRPFSLILVDLDNFKKINDTFGHLKGDEVLIAVARLILDNIRKSDSSSIMKEVEIDVPVRYGGEEMMVIMPETPLPGAIQAAERLRKVMVQEVNRLIPLVREDGERLLITGSFGVASLKPNEASDELMRRVDAAMYEAKRSGKDKVCAAD